MFGAERRQLVLELVRARGSMSIADLARAVNVSEVTVRRDVTTLERRGLLERRHGGAMLAGRADGTDDDALSLAEAAGAPRSGMFGAERRRLILTLVRANRAVSLGDLARAANVSEATVRRDLNTLEKRGLIRREHGGAVASDDDRAVPYLPDDEAGARAPVDPVRAKAAIAALAATMTGGGEAIMLGAGSTVHELARHLAPTSPLTVLTNSVLVARALAHTPNVELAMASGALDGPALALVGSTAEQWVAGHRVSRAFVSGTGVTPDRGLSTTHLGLSGVERAMVGSAREVVVLADSRKLGIETTYQVAPVGRIDHLVTDATSDSSVIDSLSARGVRVHLAQPRQPAE